ncbi:HD domain-containing protein [Hydrogenispora ethanolica]|uniref:HD domain-containing protein n=1 Tax=Hydrogenispora ethanolica TaxID=1082276 RepID=A0A4R1R8J1_HYDET|nr:HD-GYP domain-containing protein [Hydrogenispora ethanolica]TCL61870.1 HD domain-containing protein [Hydrogenispora ethanolica]
MKKVRTEELQDGMKLAKTIYSIDGKVLVRQKAELSQSLIQKLKSLGLPAAFIEEPTAANQAKVADLISEALRVDLVSSLSQLDSEIRSGRAATITPNKQRLFALVDEVLANRSQQMGMTDIRFHGDYIYGHSVHVCAIAVKIGALLGYSQAKLADLALGALFHDIGMTQIPLNLLNKTSELTPQERQLIRVHPEHGYAMLRKSAHFSAVATHVAYQHHERYDGTGYPRGLAGDAIHEFARIVAVADVYDALTTEKVYRPAKSATEAFDYIYSRSESDFDPQIVARFAKVIQGAQP